MEGGLERLRGRIEEIPARLRRFDASALALPAEAAQASALVATGAGSSLENARLLAALLAERGLAARCAPPSALLAGPDAAARDALLVVFSQALSPNGRAPLAHAKAYRGVVLVTGEDAPGDAERAAALEHAQRAGATIVRLPAPRETGLLLRVQGPLLGGAAAILLADAFARARGLAPAWPSVSGEALASAARDAAARARALRAALPGDPLAGQIALLSGTGAGAAASAGALARKLLEGLMVPLPPVWDLLDFAHGGFQQLFAGAATLLVPLAAAHGDDDALLARAARMLDPARHRVLRMEARLPGPWALVEHECIANELLAAALEARGGDPARWPGQERDAPLYDLAAAPSAPQSAADAMPRTAELARLAWPDLEALVARGARAAVLPLGSTEQHGPHLPFATDTWVADAVAERFCARLGGTTIRLPALPFGCASEHLGFPGTLSLRPETLAGVLEDLVASVARHGFETVVIFSAHGGNTHLLRDATAVLARAGGAAHVVVLADSARVDAALRASARALGVAPEDAGHHAGELETSILLALAPADVRTERAERGLVDVPRDAQSLFYPDLRANAPSGVVGDPRGARAGRASAYLDAWADALSAAFDDAKKRHHANGTKKP